MMTFDDLVSGPEPECTGKLIPYAPAVNTHDASDFDNLPDGVQFDCNTLPHDKARQFSIRFQCPRPECAKDSDANVTLSLFKSELELFTGAKPAYGREHRCRDLPARRQFHDGRTLMHAFKPGVDPFTQAGLQLAPKIVSPT